MEEFIPIAAAGLDIEQKLIGEFVDHFELSGIVGAAFDCLNGIFEIDFDRTVGIDNGRSARRDRNEIFVGVEIGHDHARAVIDRESVRARAARQRRIVSRIANEIIAVARLDARDETFIDNDIVAVAAVKGIFDA